MKFYRYSLPLQSLPEANLSLLSAISEISIILGPLYLLLIRKSYKVQ